ncbi:MAG: hypothetical protein WC784_02935 [Candidatus Shapirobacteria bacterium]|jgi:hypothetical protein
MTVELPVNTFAKRLGELSNTPKAIEAYRNSPEELEVLFVDGFNQLINTFNGMKDYDPLLEIMPGTKSLKNALNGIEIPVIGELSRLSMVRGFKDAKEAMLEGQEAKKTEQKPLRNAILIASSDAASPTALFVGSAGHFMERACFDYFRKNGVNGINGDWQKDEVLFALEECVVMLQTKFELGEIDEEPILAKIIAKPMNEGGTGWRKQEHIDKFGQDYLNLYETRQETE